MPSGKQEEDLKDKKTQALQKILSGVFDIDEALSLVAQGANPNVKAKGGHTLLHALVVSDDIDAERNIETLVKTYHADVNITCDHCKETPLQTILNRLKKLNDIKIAFLLIKLGANVNEASEDGLTLLHYLIQSELDFSSKIRQLIIEFHANMHIKTRFMVPTPKELVTDKSLGWTPHINNQQVVLDLLPLYPPLKPTWFNILFNRTQESRVIEMDEFEPTTRPTINNLNP